MSKNRWLTYENGLVLLLGFTFGIVFFDRNAINYLMPFIQEDLGLNNTQVGMIGSALSLAWALSAYFVGAMSDRSGVRKPYILISILVFSVCSAITGFAGSFMFLLLARVIMGVAEGPFLPLCLSVINEESSPARRGVNTGIVQTLFASLLGTSAAPIVLVWLANNYDWHTTFFLTGVPGLICGLLVWKYVHEPKPQVVSDLVAPKIKLTDAAREMLKVHNVRVCALISIFMVSWYLVSLIFMPIFFTAFRGFTPTEMGGLLAVTGLSTPLAGFGVPALSDRFGRKPVMVLFCFIGVITPLAALYFDGPLWMMSIMLFLGWSGSGTFPLFMGVVPGESVSPLLVASSMGLVVGIGELFGGVFAPSLAGWAADQSSLETPVIAVIFCALAAGVLSLFLQETAPQKIQARDPILAEVP